MKIDHDENEAVQALGRLRRAPEDMTFEEADAYRWAIEQDFISKVATRARLLAQYIHRTRKEK